MLSRTVARKLCRFTLSQHQVQTGLGATTTVRHLVADPSHPAFEPQFREHKIDINAFQKVALGVGSAAMALLAPWRAEMVFCMAETTGEWALNYMRDQMLRSKEGAEILRLRPRINSDTVDLEHLRSLPDNTFGRNYIKFLEVNNVTPDSRAPVQFIDNVELAYVMQRYREIHDLIHTALGMPTNLLGEIAVKWFEAIQFRLPMCIGGAVLAPIRLMPKHRELYRTKYLPWAIDTAYRAEFMLNIHFEKRWEQDLGDFHREFRIVPFQA